MVVKQAALSFWCILWSKQTVCQLLALLKTEGGSSLKIEIIVLVQQSKEGEIMTPHHTVSFWFLCSSLENLLKYIHYKWHILLSAACSK